MRLHSRALSALPALPDPLRHFALHPWPSPGKRPGWHDGTGEVALHPSSICHPLETQQLQRPYLTYLEKVGRVLLSVGVASRGANLLGRGQLQVHHWYGSLGTACAIAPSCWPTPRPLPAILQVRTSRTFIRDCTVASPLAILLFGGSLAVAHDSSYVQVDGWLRIRWAPVCATHCSHRANLLHLGPCAGVPSPPAPETNTSRELRAAAEQRHMHITVLAALHAHPNLPAAATAAGRLPRPRLSSSACGRLLMHCWNARCVCVWLSEALKDAEQGIQVEQQCSSWELPCWSARWAHGWPGIVCMQGSMASLAAQSFAPHIAAWGGNTCCLRSARNFTPCLPGCRAGAAAEPAARRGRRPTDWKLGGVVGWRGGGAKVAVRHQ